LTESGGTPFSEKTGKRSRKIYFSEAAEDFGCMVHIRYPGTFPPRMAGNTSGNSWAFETIRLVVSKGVIGLRYREVLLWVYQ
jgi:hypothetical protein